MAYSSNPLLPKIRREAVALVHKGWSARKVGRHLGYHHTAVVKWVAKAKKMYGQSPIPTKSSRPKHHPRELSSEVSWKIFRKRMETKRCAEVVHRELSNEGVSVSLSSVKRTLDRSGLLRKRSPWKRYHPPVDRPYPEKPGILAQLDTIHLMVSEKDRIYVFVLLDVYSRWAYAKAYGRMNAATSLRFLAEAEKIAPFPLSMLQTDHRPEFGRWFVDQAQRKHRYTRIGKPNDNAHIERFNRTVQEECLDKTKRNVRDINRALREYLPHYNGKRLHLGINLKTPMEMVPSY